MADAPVSPRGVLRRKSDGRSAQRRPRLAIAANQDGGEPPASPRMSDSPRRAEQAANSPRGDAESPRGIPRLKSASSSPRLISSASAALLRTRLRRASMPEPEEEEDLPTESAEELAEKERKRLLRKAGARVLMCIARAGIFIKAAGWSRRHRLRIKTGAEREQMGDLWLTVARAKADQGDKSLCLPCATDMQALPGHLRGTFRNLAVETLRNHLYPRALLWLERRRKKALQDVAAADCPKLTIEVLKQQIMFRDWPRRVLEQVPPLLRVEAFFDREIVMHEREPGTCIYFLMVGRFEVRKRYFASAANRRDSISKKNQKQLKVLSPVTVVGEFSILTEEPRMASIRALSSTGVGCCALVLRRADLLPLLQALPGTLFTTIVDLAFEARNRNMEYTHPMTVRGVRALSPILRPCSDEVLRLMISKLTSYCVPKGLVVCRSEQVADSMYLLCNGRCGVMRTVARRIAGGERKQGSPRAEETHVRTLVGQDTIGVVAVLQGVNYGDTVQTLTTCDFWRLAKEDFDQAVRSDAACQQPMLAAARDVRQRQLAEQQNLFRQAIYDLPILRAVCSREQLRELVHAFQARLYKPFSMICSTADYADRVIVLYKGKVRVGHSGRWHAGEAVGFTCVVAHRWVRAAVSLNVGECLEFPLAGYEAFLARHQLLDAVVAWVTTLMFPFAPESQHPDMRVAHEFVSDLRTPPMYPRSESHCIDWNQQGFSATRPRHQGSAAREEAAEQAEARSGAEPQSPLKKRLAAAPSEAFSLDGSKTALLASELSDILSRAPQPNLALGRRDEQGRRRRPRPYDWLAEPVPDTSTTAPKKKRGDEAHKQHEGAGDKGRGDKGRGDKGRGDKGRGGKERRKDGQRREPDDAAKHPGRGGVRLGTTQVWRLGGVGQQAMPRSVMLMSGHYPPREPRGTLFPTPDEDFGAPWSRPYFRWKVAELAALGQSDQRDDTRLQPLRAPLSAARRRKQALSEAGTPASSHWYSPQRGW
eukprot:TRINITY_DN8075_c0_g1_i1.p1 TRINITY_DN8075_c0_g1~~TRINITY_DN8075_c0_g1_i1.p1  ORF type:complete len:992 (+),score=350.21 TRINITY_DN8075_c0_g1_i1:49-3024(+)